MARAMTGAAVGRVNRRFLFLALILAVLSAVLVYAGVSKSGGGTATQTDIQVVYARQSIPAGTLLTAEMLGVREAAENSVGIGFFTSIQDTVGKLVQFPIAANASVLNSSLAGTTSVPLSDSLSYVVEENKRGMAIGIDLVVGAGGLVLPGDHVDIFFVPDNAADVLTDHVGAMLIAENIEVLAVQQVIVNIAPTAPGLQDEDEVPAATTEEGDGRVPGGAVPEPIPQAATVTLLLTPAQAQQIFCAEMSGVIRIAVRAFQDNSPTGIAPSVCILRADDEL